MIATLETVHGRALRDVGPLDFLIRKHWTALDLPPWPAIRASAFVGDIAVRVNHGRWIVDCPVEGCSAAQLASDTDHRFVCVECAAGPYRVVWPEEREAIEQVLEGRPQPARNWEPGETVDDLHAENEVRL